MKPLSPWAATLMKCAAAAISHFGEDRSLLILGYHRVLPEPDPLLPDEPDVAKFTVQVDILSTICTVLPLVEAIERLFAGSLPPRAACITFDDGYANNLTHAAPILLARRLPATVFIATRFLGGGRMWNDTVIESVRRAGTELDLSREGLGRFKLADMTDRRAAIQRIIAALKYLPSVERERKAMGVAELVAADLEDTPMLSEAQVRQIVREGIDIGAHTVTHPILAKMEEAGARREIESSKAMLEAVIGAPVRLFAYPNGFPHRDYERAHVEMVRQAGFSAAVSAAWGVCRRGSDRFQLPRMLPWEASPLKFGGRLLHGRWARQEEAV